jgi:hypothetical protein
MASKKSQSELHNQTGEAQSNKRISDTIQNEIQNI